MSEAVNQVDTSQETVDAEFAALIEQADSDVSESAQSTVQSESATIDNDTGDIVDDSLKVDMAAAVIKTSLVFAIENVTGLDVESQHYDNVSQSLAVVIVKHFDGGLFEFLALYKEEIAALTAVILFLKAVREAAAKRAKEQEEKEGEVEARR